MKPARIRLSASDLYTKLQFPKLFRDSPIMAKSRNPDTYNPLIRQILQQALDHGYYGSAGMEHKYAHSLRFDLNGYKKALESTGSPDFETMGFASVSLRKVSDTHSIIEVYPGGPAWTTPDAMVAITAGLEKKEEDSAEVRMKRLIENIGPANLS